MLSLSEDEKKEIFSHISKGVNNFYKENPGFWAGSNNPMFGKTHSEKSRNIMSDKHIGEQNSQYGTMWICNDLTKESKKISKTKTIPEGWRKGRFQEPNNPEQIEKWRQNALGYKWITNGLYNKQLRVGQIMPEGFYYGTIRKLG